MTIDNFDILMKHMDFVDPNDRYIVHVMRRPKDCKALANQLGASEAQRLIRTYYIDNIDYLKSKIPAIKELCKSCNARAYLIVSPKNNFECLLNLGKKILDVIQNKDFSVKPEHLLRQAYCENHKTRKKRWIIDLDNDEMHGWTKDEVISLVKEVILSDSKSGSDEAEKLCREIYEVPTRNGVHIVTPPFNLQKAQRRCPMMFEGTKKGIPAEVLDSVNNKYSLIPEDNYFKNMKSRYNPFNACSESCFNEIMTIPEDEMTDAEYCIAKAIEEGQKDIPGWLHKDGMTLMFYSNDID